MKTSKLFSALFILFIAFGCQPNDVATIIGSNNPPSPQHSAAITTNSRLAKLMLRIAKFNSNDKAIKPRCYNFAYPVEFKFNGVDFIIKEDKDFSKIELAITNFMTKEDVVKFKFPIIISSNEQKYLAEDNKSLKEILTKCGQYEDDDAIDNLEISYPINFVFEDSNSSQELNSKINTNDELIRFLLKTSNDRKFKIQYPVNLLYENQPTSVSANEVFEKITDDAINQYLKALAQKSDNILSYELSYLGNWNAKIDYEYILDFNDDGSVFINIANSKIKGITGNWILFNNIETTELLIEVDPNSPMAALNKKWIIKQTTLGHFVLEGINDKGAVIAINLHLEYPPK
jgi:hypothetical protein